MVRVEERGGNREGRGRGDEKDWGKGGEGCRDREGGYGKGGKGEMMGRGGQKEEGRRGGPALTFSIAQQTNQHNP